MQLRKVIRSEKGGFLKKEHFELYCCRHFETFLEQISNQVSTINYDKDNGCSLD